MFNHLKMTAIAVFFPLITAAQSIEAQTFKSGPEQVSLIELYTSEGCSSCPPADKWLSNLKQHDGLWTQFVPIAFHVDYWDWIGWTDDFAKPEFGLRQKHYKSLRKARSVYTPGFFINGSEWRGFFRNVNASPPVDKQTIGTLLVKMDNSSLNVRFTPSDPSIQNDNLIFTAALLEFSKSHFIKWGENIGKTLHHDFITRELKMSEANKNNHGFESKIDIKTRWHDKTDRAIAVWVSRKENADILQATGGWINGDEKK